MSSLRIRPMLWLLGGAICTSFVTAVGLGMFAESSLKVNGALYKDIVRGKDLIADVLPPPAYLIESYLESSLIALDPSSVDDRAERLAQLRKDYEARHEFWSNDNRLPDAIHKLVVETSHAHAERFWSQVETVLVPAARSGDPAALQNAFGELTETYAAHRGVVDQIVSLTNAENADIEREAADQAALLEGLVLFGTAAAFLVTLVGLWLMSRRIVSPIVETTNVMNRICVGDIEVEIAGADRGDEIGDMARSITIFRDGLVERARLARDASQTSERERERQQRLETLVSKFRVDITKFMEGASQEVAQTRATADDVGRSAHSSADRATSAARGSQTASEDMQSVSAAAEELTASIRELAAQADRARSQAEVSRNVSARGETEMRALNEQAQKISAVVEMIQTLAEQTNLLALNATIEAARAGEAGRGFAVVAAEVKSLAEQTAKSTGEIEGIISTMQRSVEGVGQAFTDSISTLGEIESIVTEMASSVAEQNAATTEISSAITRTSARAGENAQDISELARAADFTRAATDSMKEASDRIALSTKSIGAAIETFLKCVNDDLDDRRVAVRVMTDEAIVVRRDGQRFRAMLRDLSATGARASIDGELHVGEGISIEWVSGRIEPSKVVWVRGNEAGIAFTLAQRAAA